MRSKRRFFFTILAIAIVVGIAFLARNAGTESSSPVQTVHYAPNEIRNPFHTLEEFVGDTSGYPNVAYPMSFKIKGPDSTFFYNIEGYVADDYTAQKRESEQWPRHFHYLIDFLAQFLHETKDDLTGQNIIRGKFVYTMDPIDEKCPDGWEKRAFKVNQEKCAYSASLPIIYSESGDYHGCEKGTPEKSGVIGLPGEHYILCFGVKDEKSDFVYSVYKGRYEEGNYLYYVATEKKRNENPPCPKNGTIDVMDTLRAKLLSDITFKQRDPNHCFLYEKDEDINGVCNNGWRPLRYIAPYADSSSQIEVYCYYKIPEPTIEF